MSFFHFACPNLAAAKLPHGRRRMPPGMVDQPKCTARSVEVFKVLCSDLAEGADRGAYLSCRFKRAVREPTDELQGVSV